MHRILPIALLALNVSDSFPVWLRETYEDAVVVQRSEVIAEAHIKGDSIQEVKHEGEGSWEHHAVLIVVAVHKGRLDANEIPVVIHYGLDPRITATGAIQLWDTGNSAHSPRPVLEDIGKDHIWFLRKRGGLFGREPGTGDYGIVDPEDVRILKLKDYLLAYQAADPEKAVRAVITNDPELQSAAQSYFDHLEIQRILKLVDPTAKAEKLLPYFIKRHYWNGEWEAHNALVRIGHPAGAALRSLFDDPKLSSLREDVIRAWGEMNYEPSLEILTAMLRDQDMYWKRQKLGRDWWSREWDSQVTKERREYYGLVYSSVTALRKIGDPRGREAVELTRRRWSEILTATQWSTSQIVDECDAALNVFSEKK